MANGVAGIATVGDNILQGEPQTYSFTLKDAAVTKGMLVTKKAAGQVTPATAGDKVLGMAMHDAAVDEKLTIAFPGNGFVARMILTENQNVALGEPVGAGSITIDGVETKGLVAEVADQAFSATVAKTEAEGLIAQLKAHVGIALEAKVTDADHTAVIKVLFVGASL